jgi:uroporphyrin-III C-methyltransferase
MPRPKVKKKHGKVYLVGAGPGDPELITLKGLRRLKEADAVLYDHLIPRSLLKKVKRGAELISAGKKHGKHSLSQDAIQALLLQKAREGKTVIRLKGGDPYVFGRGGEEMIFLRGHGIPVEVVPGVSSAIAVPAMAGIPVTHRHLAMTAAFASGHVTEDNDPIPVPDADTLVYLMCVSDLEKTVTRLLRKKKAATPCAMIENGTMPRERVITGTLSTIVKKARNARIVAPAVFIVGDVVKLRESFGRPGKQ